MPNKAPVFLHRKRKPWENQGAGADKRLRGRKAVEQRKRRLLAEQGMCRICRSKGILRKADVIDHIKPLAKGGTDDDENTRPLCHECHDQVTREQFGRKPKPRTGPDGWPIQ